MPLILILTIVCVVTYTFEITFGLAGTILMVVVMSHFYDTQTLVIYSILPQILVGTIGLIRSPKNVSPRYLGSMVAYAFIGAMAGLFLFYQFSNTVFHTLLASAITLFGTYLVVTPGKFKLNNIGMRILDIVAGMSQALFGISGPIAMTRLMGTFQSKLEIRNYALAFFLSMNIVRMAGYLLNHTISGEIVSMMMYSGPILAITLWFSNHLHLRINEVWFRRTVSWMILLGGISLFYTVPE
jgi:uncharacterized membrane protein YfcA